MSEDKDGADFTFELATKIYFGEGCLERICEEAPRLGRRVLLVTGRSFAKRSGLVDKVSYLLERSGVVFTVFSDAEPNPRINTVDRGAQLAREVSCDMTIGLGGGSAIDTAKTIAALATNEGRCIDYKGEEQIRATPLPIIAIPTTSGSGAEVTRYAVFINPENRDKFEIISRLICPKVALVDPVLSMDMPPSLTSSTGIDALTHAIEGYVSRRSQPIVDCLALRAIELISKNLVKAVRDGRDREARREMSLASLLGGTIINNMKTGIVHAMARPLGGQFDVPHGVANAIILPWALRFNLGVIPERARRIAEAMGLHVDGLSKDKLVETIFEALEGLIANVGIPRRLSELGVPHGAIKDLARVAASVERIKYVNPRPITLEDIERLYEEAMSGEK